VLRAVKGESGIVQPSFVYLPGVAGGEIVQKSVDGLEFFSTNVELGVISFEETFLIAA
jgi:malate dehydrogenase